MSVFSEKEESCHSFYINNNITVRKFNVIGPILVSILIPVRGILPEDRFMSS